MKPSRPTIISEKEFNDFATSRPNTMSYFQALSCTRKSRQKKAEPWFSSGKRNTPKVWQW